jgi:hypothetical protein
MNDEPINKLAKSLKKHKCARILKKDEHKLVKSAMELSVLFKKEVLLSIMDNEHMVLYSSSKRSSEAFKANLVNPKVRKDVLTNKDVNLVVNVSI